jgi:hypothetical protein
MTQKRSIRFGLLRGRVRVSSDFDAPLTFDEFEGTQSEEKPAQPSTGESCPNVQPPAQPIPKDTDH